MKLSLIKQQIQKALDMWNFSMAERLYQNNFESFDDIKSEYIKFLYDTGQLYKFYNLLNDYNEKPNWWPNDKLSFIELKSKFSNFLDLDNSICAKDSFPNDIANAFMLIQGVDSGTLESEFALQIFKDHLFNSQNILLKSYIAALMIDYFALMDEGQKEKFFVPIRSKDCSYYFLIFLHSLMNIEGVKNYWDKYHLRTQYFYRNNMNLPKKRIAICFYGVLRGAWKENLQEIIDVMAKPLNADCFLFSWDEYQQWPSLMGGGHWANRAFKREIAKLVPQEISTHAALKKYMPFTYHALHSEYNLKIEICEIEDLVANNSCIKSYQLDNQENFYQNYGNAKLFHGYYSSFKLMESYEYENKFLYDIVIMNRVDVKPYPIDIDTIEKLQPNEIADYMCEAGSGSGCFVGYREAIKNYLSMCEHKAIIEQNRFFVVYGHNHELGYKYPAMLGYRIIKPIVSSYIVYTTALNGLCFPRITKEVEYDCNILKKNKIFTNKQINQIMNFFNYVSNSYDAPSPNARIIYRLSPSTLCKARIKNQLSYKFGNAMIENSKSVFGYIKIPYVLYSIKKQHNKEQKEYNKKIKANPCLKLPPLESYPDYQEAIKIKEHLSYKLGEALIKAHKNWHKGGYIKLWFDIAKIKKEHKNKKAKNENR